ncbi:MAG TPA: hypothetical protein VFR65_01065 [Nitrososphaeraceae archaeon]|nr:hypothetical protein [Nitrososphaeraceae archaeon]
MKQIISILSISLLLTLCLGIYNLEANKTYINHDGNQLTQDEFDERIKHCESMQEKGIIPSDKSLVDCETWVLTPSGEQIIVEYIIQKEIN